MDELKQKTFHEPCFKLSKVCKATHSISRYCLSDIPVLVGHLLHIKLASAKANADCAEISSDTAARIVKSILELQRHLDAPYFMVDVLQGGGGFAINGNINEAIVAHDARSHDLPLAIKDINHSQSSADVCATAMRLGLHDQSHDLLAAIHELVSSLKDNCSFFGSTTTLARTCWQDALPITMEDRFTGIIDGFTMCAEELSHKAQNLLKLPMGTTVLGTSAGSSPFFRARVLEHLSDILDKHIGPQLNSVTSAQNFPDLAFLANAIKIITENVIRFCLDLRLLNSGPRGGLSEIQLPKIVQSSSFFPNKFNPTIVETAIQGAVYAQSMASATAIYRIFPEIDLNVFEWSAGMQLYFGMEILTASIRCLNDRAVKGMSVNTERCRELANFAHSFSR